MHKSSQVIGDSVASWDLTENGKEESWELGGKELESDLCWYIKNKVF